MISCISKNNIDFEINSLKERIMLLTKEIVFNNYIAFTSETYNNQLFNCDKLGKFNIGINDNGISYITSNEDCVFQSHFCSLEDKINDKLCDELLVSDKRNVKDFKKYILKSYNINLGSDNIKDCLSEFKKYDKHLYYKMFEQCSEKLRKEHLNNAELAYLDYMDMLKEELLILESERKRYFD